MRRVYLAVADRFFGPVIDRLGEAGLLHAEGDVFRRVVIEKPFGHDLESARALNARILKQMDERQIYRIDHFLGKETVQNIMALRFSNGIFEPIWEPRAIDFVEITAAETIGVEKRAKFYEPTGALRDMVPNHMFQLLSMVAMEPPNSFDADAVRSEKAKVIEAIHPLSSEHIGDAVVRGQYAGGKLRGEDVAAYRAEPGVDPALDDRDVHRDPVWQRQLALGRRAVLRPHRQAARVSQDRDRRPLQAGAVRAVSRDAGGSADPNVMTLHIQPSEGVSLQFSAKIPGPKVHLGGVTMDMRYADYFKNRQRHRLRDAAVRLFIGDATLFQRADNIEAGWCAVQPILDAIADGPCRWRSTKPARPGRRRRRRCWRARASLGAAGGLAWPRRPGCPGKCWW